MPTLADSISKLNIKGKTFNNPEWWSSQHKIKREVKKELYIKEIAKKARFNTQLEIFTLEKQPDIDSFIKSLRGAMDMEKYRVYAPWNPIFRKTKTIITFIK